MPEDQDNPPTRLEATPVVEATGVGAFQLTLTSRMARGKRKIVDRWIVPLTFRDVAALLESCGAVMRDELATLINRLGPECDDCAGDRIVRDTDPAIGWRECTTCRDEMLRLNALVDGAINQVGRTDDEPAADVSAEAVTAAMLAAGVDPDQYAEHRTAFARMIAAARQAAP